MSFTEALAALAQRIPTVLDHLATEEATKTALVMPFIAALGYDVFNPLEVTPELTADVGIEKGEKVDYAIKQDGEVIMLFECKGARTDLSHATMSQLYRYFGVTNARIGVLTNGIEYRFFSDLEEPNRMDQRPFLALDLRNLREDHVNEVKKLSKGAFDVDRMLSAAAELKYMREIQAVLTAQFENPDPELVRFFYTRAVPGGRFTHSAREQFEPIVQRALQQFIRERVSDRLRNALQQESEPASEVDEGTDPGAQGAPTDDGIETTADELEGYHLVKAIVREVVDPRRVVHRDTKSYMGVLLDDNNRKPICRLRFNWGTKYIGLFDGDKNETKHPIEDLNDIFGFSEQLKETVRRYDVG